MVVTCSTWYLGQLLSHTSKCAMRISHTQCSTTEVNRLFWLMAMAGLRQPKQLNNNAVPLKSISADIMFECDMKTTTTQKTVLANSMNEARLIDKLTTYTRRAGVLVKQDPVDADRLIVSTVLTLAQTERKPVFVVGTDTDLLVMLISRSSSDTDIHMLCHRNILQLYNNDELQLYVGDMMFVHAIIGCDTVSVPCI